MKDFQTETIQTAPSTDPEGPKATAGLLLAFSGSHAPAQRRLPSEGLRLGRGAAIFGGSPLSDPQLSRRHAALEKRRGRWWLSDLDSRNGTFCNGVRLTEPVRLSPGDTIQVGDTVLLFDFLGEAPGDSPLLGASAALAGIRETVAAVAPHPHAVLIEGETGTGKEVIAQQLHAHSGRRGALVAVNCAALSEGIVDSELFGHARGAFTGADTRRTGLIESSSRGTLFLDELGELPLTLQSKLLRVLETGRIRPVGDSREIAVDVRVIGATNRSLIEMVRAGSFRTDLYARLAQWTIAVPPLRERRADLPALAHHFLSVLGAGDRPVSAALGVALLRHPWPLNARGLHNVLSAAVIASPSGPLRMTTPVQAALDATRALGPIDSPSEAPAAVEPPSAERLAEVLAAHRGSVAKVARAMSASRQQVYRWLKRYDMQATDFR